MNEVTLKSEAIKMYCFHLRGFPDYWTEADLLASLNAAGVTGIKILQVLTKTETLNCGEKVIVPSGDALILFGAVEGPKFIVNLWKSRSAPAPSENLIIHVRRLHLPLKTSELQLSNLVHLTTLNLKGDCTMEENIYELHWRSLSARQEMLQMNYRILKHEAKSKASSMASQQPVQITLSLMQPVEHLELGVCKQSWRSKEFVTIRFEQDIPCYMLFDDTLEPQTANNDGTASTGKEKEIAASSKFENVSCSPKTDTYVEQQMSCFNPSTDDGFDDNYFADELFSPPSEIVINVAADKVEKVKNNETSDCSIAIKAETTSSQEDKQDARKAILELSSASAAAAPLTINILNTNEALETSILYVEGLPYGMDANAIARYFEKELGGAVYCSLRFKSKVGLRKNGERCYTYDIPQRNGAIIFKDMVTEQLCLHKKTFHCKYDSSAEPKVTQIVTVTRLECKLKVEAVLLELTAKEKTVADMNPSTTASFHKAHQSKVAAYHLEMMSEFARTKTLIEDGYQLQVLESDILVSQTDWMRGWKKTPAFGFVLSSAPLCTEPARPCSGLNAKVSLEDKYASTSNAVKPIMQSPLEKPTSSRGQPSSYSNPGAVATRPGKPSAAVLTGNPVPLLVQGIYFRWDCCRLAQYFERELNCIIKFSASYNKIVQREGTSETLKIPQGEAIIIFQTVAAQEACLARRIFYPPNVPWVGPNQPSYMKVSRVVGAVPIAKAESALKLQERVFAGMGAVEFPRFTSKYREMVKNHHIVLTQNQYRFNVLRLKEQVRFQIVDKCVFDAFNDWWMEQFRARRSQLNSL